LILNQSTVINISEVFYSKEFAFGFYRISAP